LKQREEQNLVTSDKAQRHGGATPEEVAEQVSEQVRAAQRLADAAHDLAVWVRAIPRPSDVEFLLRQLQDTQGNLANALRLLADWHGQVMPGVHHDRGVARSEIENPATRRAELALREAAQYADDATDAISRSLVANELAEWFDEIRTDEL
jgi:hypothetical protein